jgi:hypothetical protein
VIFYDAMMDGYRLDGCNVTMKMKMAEEPQETRIGNNDEY